MRCEQCGAENREESRFCRECAAPLGGGTAPRDEELLQKTEPEEALGTAAATPPASTGKSGLGEAAAEESPTGEPTAFARFLALAWRRRGPIIMSFALVLMIAMVWAPWAFIRVEVIGLSLVSRSFSGWDIYVARVLFFLLIIPLIISLMMVAGIGTRRRVLETHIITFFLGFMFLVWGAAFGLSQVLKSLMKNLKVVQVIPASAQIATLIFLLILVVGIIITQYDRGRQLLMMSQGG